MLQIDLSTKPFLFYSLSQKLVNVYWKYIIGIWFNPRDSQLNLYLLAVDKNSEGFYECVTMYHKLTRKQLEYTKTIHKPQKSKTRNKFLTYF